MQSYREKVCIYQMLDMKEMDMAADTLKAESWSDGFRKGQGQSFSNRISSLHAEALRFNCPAFPYKG